MSLELYGEIDERRFKELENLKKKGELKWLNTNEQCPNCGKLAKEYNQWNPGGCWKKEYFCRNCDFDSWVEKANWFNFDMMVLGGV